MPGRIAVRRHLVAAATSALLLAGCGSAIRPELASNHPAGFDFRRPPRCPAFEERSSEELVSVRSLGTGGLHVSWRGASLLIGPFFSNPGVIRAALGRLRWDRAAIAAGLEGVPAAKASAILAGHAHYDHFGDLPVVAREHATRASILVNRSGVHMLAPYPDLVARARTLEDLAGRWVTLEGEDGERLPIRIMPLLSDHAPQIGRIHWSFGEVESPWSGDWERRRLRHFRCGRTFAFLIDFLDEDLETVRFRMFYQDAASSATMPELPQELASHDVDLAVVCVASFHLAGEYPAGILGRLRPHHVLATHFEDFFRSRQRPVRFVPLLTNGRAGEFLDRVNRGLAASPNALRGPLGAPCGPASSGWTMPLPGETLHFDPASTEVEP